MLSAHFGTLIRKQRLAKGLKQAELARAAGVSRTVLSGLEQGKPRPVQTDVLDRVFHALEISPLATDPIMEERRRLRLEQRLKLERQRNRHLRLAVELAGNPKSAKRLIAAARSMVELWKRNKTCSPFYIERWSRLLALPPRELALRMTSLGEWEDALFQNTPWSSAWT